jgi:hypothetical protein
MLGAARKFFSMLLQFGQVVEGIGIAKLARMDEAHEQVANEKPAVTSRGCWKAALPGGKAKVAR